MATNDKVSEAKLAWTDVAYHPSFRFRMKRLGHEAGGKQLACTLYELAPGQKAFPLHLHLANEEAVYVLSGAGVCRIGDKEIPVEPGDYIAFPAGMDHPHQMRASDQEVLRFLCLSTMIPTDVTMYPDSKKTGVLHMGAKPHRAIFKSDSQVDYYEGER